MDVGQKDTIRTTARESVCESKSIEKTKMTTEDALLKLRKWEAEIKAKNALNKEDKEAVEAIEKLVEETKERAKDGLDAKDIFDTVRGVEKVVEEVSESSCWCWGKKKPLTS